MTKYKYIFGPVPSRRLGVSLGVDIVPYKTCAFNCVYCECGRTTDHTTIRKPYIKARVIIRELKNYLKDSPRLDYITFSGGGEPTLNSDIGKIVGFLKDEFPSYKLALLTNGGLLGKKQERDDIKRCDVIIPSLDAVSDEAFAKINRPCPGIKVVDIVQGIKKIKQESSGRIWIEVFIVPSINDSRQEIDLIKKALLEISPDRVQLNTLDRPGTEGWVVPASAQELARLARSLKPLRAEVIAGGGVKKGFEKYSSDIQEKIISTLKRRPCTADDLAGIFSLRIDILNRYLNELEDSDKIVSEKKERGVFFKVKNEFD
jgi:wyosine [tRNA(Phe)-imidazoG37] synthetase (radical SAM superfamily)